MGSITNPLLKKTLRQGSVWKMPLLSITEPHFLIVLNKNPLSGKLILLSLITSKVQKRLEIILKTGKPLSTIVQFGPEEYDELDRPSCVDCNTLKSVDASFFDHAVDLPNAHPCNDLPAPLLKRIIDGILESPGVSPSLKTLIR